MPRFEEGRDERTIPRGDAAYPARLLDVPHFTAPPLLHVRGQGPWPPGRCVAVIGARAATPYARRVASEVARALALAGVWTVSGLARGVDRAAHEAALAAGGPSLAVLGTSVEQVYPPEHVALYTALRAGGGLVSTLPRGSPPRPGHFPMRNRLLAAFADGVVLVQAEERSGAHHTVRAALRFGRWVLVAPWPLGEPAYQGNADWVARVHERVGVLTDAAQAARRASNGASVPPTPGEDPPAPREVIAAVLSPRPQSLDALVARTGLPVPVLACALIELELAGRIERLPGDRYRRRTG